ncbi:MAG TPA: hypothetical protein VF765_35660 [Polyangiaceae bacterium]
MRGWILAAFLLLACGSSSPGGSGLDGGSAATSSGGSGPDAYVLATLGPGPSGSCSAKMTSTVFALGTASAGHPATVQNGANAGGGVASVSCTVHPNGGGFELQLSAQVGGPLGGSLTIGPDTVAAFGGQALAVSIAGGGGALGYSENPCTLTYVYGGQPVPVSTPIAAGRIWGHVSCTNAGPTLSSDPPGNCDLEADFLFEQCGQ